jgi:hypothetical protein
LVSFDLGAIRNSDCQGSFYPSPNGLYAEEACQLSRYAGLSDNTCCFGLFELNAENYPQSAHLSSQLIWHYIEAFSQRKSEKPNSIGDFKKFIVESSTPGVEMIFYKSLNSDNWWMEIPILKEESSSKKNIIISCSYNDYVAASNREIPERWLRVYNKVI